MDHESSVAFSFAVNSGARAATPVRAAISYSRIARRQSGHPARCASSLVRSSAVNSPAVADAHSSRNSSCEPIGQMPRLIIRLQFVTHGLSPVQFAAGQVFSKLFKASIMMVSYVRVGLPEFLGDLVKRKSFEEMQSQRLPLLSGKRAQYFPPAVPSEKSLNALVVFCPFITRLVTFDRLVRDSGQIESVRFQFPST